MMAVLLGQILCFLSCLFGRHCRFIGFVLFLVYVGGLIILLSYCVILVPTNKLNCSLLCLFTPLLLGFIIIIDPIPNRTVSFEILNRSRAILLVGLLLFMVMLSVVEIINYSLGMMKNYAEYILLCFILNSYLMSSKRNYAHEL